MSPKTPSKKITGTNLQFLEMALPPLRVDTNYATKRPSLFRHVLISNQIKHWQNFIPEVRTTIAGHIGSATGSSPVPPVLQDFHFVGNELGLQSRYIEYVSNVMNGIFLSVSLGISIADAQCGVPHVKSKAKPFGNLSPDMVFISDSNHEIRVVGEVKTFWTFSNKKAEPWEDFLATKFGQIGVYMDQYNCRYGFFTTYNKTWLLKRTGPQSFLYSGAMEHRDIATTMSISVRQAFLYLGLKAADRNESIYADSPGNRLMVQDRKPQKTKNVKGDSQRKRKRARVDIGDAEVDVGFKKKPPVDG